MTGTHPFSELMDEFSPERKEKIRKRVERTLRRMHLKELREARSLSQVALAKKLKVNQPAISKMEKNADMYVSTLRHYIHATGGKLQIIAKYPDAEVEIRNFSGV